VQVCAQLSGLSGHINLDQTFLNSYDTPLEATYIFPLPAQAAVTSFRLEVKNRVVEGVIKERGEARQEYTQAIQSGHRAAIAEEERDGVSQPYCTNGPVSFCSGFLSWDMHFLQQFETSPAVLHTTLQYIEYGEHCMSPDLSAAP
jgi:hypothetical protein